MNQAEGMKTFLEKIFYKIQMVTLLKKKQSVDVGELSMVDYNL